MFDAEDLRVIRHESLHCVAALHYGWEVAGVSREVHVKGSGETLSTPNLNAFEATVVLLIPLLDNPGGEGCHYDLEQVDRFLDYGVKLSDVWTECQKLLADPDFRSRARKIETALYSRPRLTGIEATLIAAS